MGKNKRNEKNVNGFVEKTADFRGVTDRRVEEFNAECRKVDKKKKSSKGNGKGSKDVGIKIFVEEEPIGDIDRVGGKDKGEEEEEEEEKKKKKKKKKKRKMELEKNTWCCEDDTVLKPPKSIKRFRGNKMQNDGECFHHMVYDVVKAKEPPNEYYHVGEEKSVGDVVISKDEEGSVGVKQSRLIKNETKERKKDNINKDKEEISSLLVNGTEILKYNATIGCKTAGKEESSYCTKGKGGQQMEEEEKKKKNKKKKEKEKGKEKEEDEVKEKEEEVEEKKKKEKEKERGEEEEEKKKKKKKKKLKKLKKLKIYDKMPMAEECGSKFLKTKSSDEVFVEGGTSTAIGRENLEDKDCVGEGSTKSQGHAVSHNKKRKDSNKGAHAEEVEKKSDKNKRKKAKSVRDVLVEKADKGDLRRKRTSQGDYQPPNSKISEPSKRVRFSGHVEVFPSPHITDLVEEDKKMDVVQGKRFSREEDEMIKTSVLDYIKEHELGEEGLDMILHCRSYPKLTGCWKDIAKALPWRTYQSVYYRGHTLFERDENRKWTQEEYELIRRVHEKHGSKWKMMADVLGKNRVHVKDTWRRIKLPNMKRGHWSQEEIQSLFDLVNIDLRMKAFEQKKSKHGMLRDNICWGAISDKLSTRTTTTCCQKWYGQLTSPMVAEGLWVDADDYHLMQALYDLDACCVEDVDWDNLLDHRSGDVCLKRWNQMVSHIGEHGCKSFAEQVEVLSKRYCPDLLEVREAYDSKPAAP
ncbi:hypothetical protein NE237_031289 [Protea cynaroides]|uniref:Cyclin-D-binding Myb-like transcription factor 1 n=1 Tax=Protea cynaroides TaxID=273540 RepID=A0A9Q0L0X4_9MAGN|nr:hypothetical protein NE237_031289 [Protea cynaroides]